MALLLSPDDFLTHFGCFKAPFGIHLFQTFIIISACKAFSRFIKDASIPPYFDRHL